MAIYLEVDGRSVALAIDDLQRFMDNKSELYRVIGRSLRDYVRQTITIQGRGTPWLPLAKSTTEKTGRRKVFITLRNDIQFKSTQNEVVVDLVRPQIGWNIKQHAKGYTIPARKPVNGKTMKWNTTAGAVFARSAKAARVPARSLFPSAKDAAAIVTPIVNHWLKEHINKTWR